MTRLILHIFGLLKANALLRWTSLVVLTAVLGLLLTRQSYKEDISDFLPLDNGQQLAFQDYQNTSSARRIYVIFETPDSLSQTVLDQFCETLEKVDTATIIDYMTADNPKMIQEAINVIYAQIPYQLTTEDYARMDSLKADVDVAYRGHDNLANPTRSVESVSSCSGTAETSFSIRSYDAPNRLSLWCQ